MAAEKRPNKEKADEIEKTVDPYTGELKPVAEDADQFIEVMPEETDDRDGSNYLLNEETSMDSYAADADADAVAEQSAHYTEDEDMKKWIVTSAFMSWRSLLEGNLIKTVHR